MSEETKRKISESKKGHHVSEETRRKISEKLKGRPITAEQRQKLIDANTGRPAWNRGKTMPPEVGAKISAALKGKPKTAEHNRKVSEAHKARNAISETAGYGSIHEYVNRRHPKTGVCERCGAEVGLGWTGTEMAFQRHPEPYTRDRGDYMELCRPCHRREHQELGAS